MKVTLTRGGDLDPAARFFTEGTAERLVYCATPGLAGTRDRLASVATVLDAGPAGDLGGVLADLTRRGVRRLMVEGGQRVQHGRHRPEPLPGAGQPRRRAVDQPLGRTRAENRAPGSSSPPRVSTTRTGDGGSPLWTRPAGAAPDRTTSRGSSRPDRAAPTRIASQPARSASTRSRSAGPDRTSRRADVSSRQPSSDTAQLSSTYGRDGTGPTLTGRTGTG